ncbi:uncharacterized protein RCC_05825 [Ramularia collo-cygni]|uniref:N-acetyltransferase domain-containing protein n=1 Tax=Ramularia collo-cygni TaxID=112498 RepID=A0A2D3UX29_9PEZI|nr:uncharacterized protein RCC_05825 [Ramularia collo-cygni]CZT19968.1 uncharacterized protein RCC_05825 [Ramularia collo-cygni]
MISKLPKERIQTTPQVYLRWAVRDDIPAISRILHRNFLVFELHDHTAPERRERPEEFYVFTLNRVRKFFVQPGFRFMVAERRDLGLSEQNQKSEIMGFAGWETQGRENPLTKEWSQSDGGWLTHIERQLIDIEILHHRYFQSDIFDYGAFKKIIDVLHASYEDLECLRSNIHLQFLFVDPAWQKGHGVGNKLLQWGLDVSDQLGVPVVLEASLAGHGFYLKKGFTCHAKVLIDIKPEKAYETPIMIYQPGAGSRKAIGQ